MKKLSPEKFACEADAIKGLSNLFKQFKYHQINESKVTQIKSKKRDRSGEISYEISATVKVSQNEIKINTESLRAGHLFSADSIFLKSPERIESLGMMMDLCLLVYSLSQRQIITPLRESKSTVKNQLGKPTDRPTLRWIFPCFQSIHLVTLNQEQHICYWTQERDFIVNLLPYHCFALI